MDGVAEGEKKKEKTSANVRRRSEEVRSKLVEASIHCTFQTE